MPAPSSSRLRCKPRPLRASLSTGRNVGPFPASFERRDHVGDRGKPYPESLELSFQPEPRRESAPAVLATGAIQRRWVGLGASHRYEDDAAAQRKFRQRDEKFTLSSIWQRIAHSYWRPITFRHGGTDNLSRRLYCSHVGQGNAEKSASSGGNHY